ncbi:Carcinoembryonic antigen-related cell adhesion molecule 1 [Cricetulus griseus]|uniref:Carcinoembryonic antigen-related cell adhesion molecule 1 n=1 Tax=Cricetulus griseus TaxID=10029 RepID=G3IA17_CRIGR|nr:Carcinoembryonic antigen-related cell adhesion molecule 1 [Cricetulus griseus]
MELTLASLHKGQVPWKGLLLADAVAKPTIQIFNTTVKEYEAVNITCVTDDPKNSIRWHFNGHVLQLPDRMMLYQNGGILSIQSVREEDSGLYECEVFNSAVSKKSDPIQLDVIRECPLLPHLLHSVGVGQFLYQQNGQKPQGEKPLLKIQKQSAW